MHEERVGPGRAEGGKEKMKKAPELEVVIATYHEDLKWITELPKGRGIKHTIYRAVDGLVEPKKDKVGDIPVIKIPNGGREAGQYLWHIIHNHDDLAKVTVFLQGDYHRHGQQTTLQKLIPPTFWDDPREMAYLGVLREHDRIWPHEHSPMHLTLHGSAWGKNVPPAGMFSVGAQIWAKRELVQKWPVRHYEKYYAQRNEGHFAHLLEATWHTVFGVYR